MGADIHMYAEKRLKNGEWATVQTFAPVAKRAVGMAPEGSVYDWMFYEVQGRNYALFATLAGVRGFGRDPLGIPDDASALFKEYAQSWGSDAHSHSYCSAAQFVTDYLDTIDSTDQAVKNYATWVLDVGANNAVLRFLDAYCAIRVSEDDTADDYRFVFFFDN
jgi:hypothetical protein